VTGKSERQQNSAGAKPTAQHPLTGGYLGKGQSHCVDPGANGEEKFQDQPPDFQKVSDANLKQQRLTSRKNPRSTVKNSPWLVTFFMMQQLPLGLHSLMS
jgi:hypothetical protein